MPFLFFDQKNNPSIVIPTTARDELMTEINHDFPSYVLQLPCIYDASDRKCYNGLDACVEYLTRFQPPPTPEPVVVVVPVVPEPKLVAEEVVEPKHVDEEPKKKITRARKPKAVAPVTETVI